MAATVEDLRVRVENLARTSDLQALYPIDWYRFYEIVIFAVQEGLDKQFDSADLAGLLKDSGFSPDIVGRLTFMYTHGGEMLRQFLAVAEKT